MLSQLKVLSDRQAHTKRELPEKMADHFGLTPRRTRADTFLGSGGNLVGLISQVLRCRYRRLRDWKEQETSTYRAASAEPTRLADA